MLRASCRTRSSSVLLALVFALALALPRSSAAQHALVEPPAAVDASLAALLACSAPIPPVAPPSPTSQAIAGPAAGMDRAPRAAMRRPTALPALYASFVALQMLDVHSTMRAVSAGGTEANPTMKGLVAQPGAFVAAKIAATAGTMLLSERLWRKHRTAAVLLMAAVNASYAAIVASNYRERRAGQ